MILLSHYQKENFFMKIYSIMLKFGMGKLALILLLVNFIINYRISHFITIMKEIKNSYLTYLIITIF